MKPKQGGESSTGDAGLGYTNKKGFERRDLTSGPTVEKEESIKRDCRSVRWAAAKQRCFEAAFWVGRTRTGMPSLLIGTATHNANNTRKLRHAKPDSAGHRSALIRMRVEYKPAAGN